MYRLYFPLILLFCLSSPASGQKQFLMPSDTFNQARFWACAGVGAGLYAGASVGLYHAWYKNYDLGPFRTFDDSGEWMGMDKAGHLMTAYTQADIAYRGLRWTGLRPGRSTLLAIGVGTVLQGTIEVMDGFSEKWGFSWYDIGFNTLGVGAFAAQQWAWGEQRIRFKMSNTRPKYSTAPIFSTDGAQQSTLRERAYDLYGQRYAEAFLKDYNGQIIWASANLASFCGEDAPSWLPPWLNLAAGYGASNMYGGYGNTWADESTGANFSAPAALQRQRQFYLSFDIDLKKIPFRKPWLRTACSLLNWIKIPSPSLELSPQGKVRFHPMLW